MITALLLVLAQVAAAPPAAKLGGGFGQPGSTVRRARVTISDVGTPRPATAPVVAAAPATDPPTAPAVDDEALWRGRLARLRDEYAAAMTEYQTASAVNTVVTWGSPSGRTYNQLMAVRNAALTPYRVKLAEISRELAGLPDECRRTSGCQPGWVR